MKKLAVRCLVLSLFFILSTISIVQGADIDKFGRYPNSFEGNFVCDGLYAYYVRHSYYDNNDNLVPAAIIKHSLLNETETILCELKNGSITTLNYIDGWIYFLDTENQQAEINKIKTDGTGLTCIHTVCPARPLGYLFDYFIDDMLIIEDMLYYTCSRGVMELELNSGVSRCINEASCFEMTADDKHLYWVKPEDDIVFCYNFITKNISTFTIYGQNGYKVWGDQLQLSSAGKLYLYDVPADVGKIDDDFYSFNTDGSSQQMSESTYGRSYIIIENQIYYWEDGHIYKKSLIYEDTPTKVNEIPLGRTGKYFSYHNGYIYTYDFIGNRQVVNFYKVDKTKEILVTVNDKNVLFDQPPIIVEERTLVPVRAIFEALGATVEWTQETQTVTTKKDGKTVEIQIGNNIMKIDNEEIALDVPAQIVNERTLVPARAVAEAFDCIVDWDGDTSTVIIESK